MNLLTICKIRQLIAIALLFSLLHFKAFGETQVSSKLIIGNFSKGLLSHWQNKEFKGKTEYKIIDLEQLKALRAISKNSASGLFFEKKIDLQQTPVLNWRWRIGQRLTNNHELEKLGDDFAARVYVVVSGGLVFWNTKAINYVWASQVTKGKSWPNPFAGEHAMMLALRSADDKIGEWYAEKRNVRADFKRLTGEDVRYIDAVAIMTDTDNSKGAAETYYGDIYFSAN